MRHWIAAFGCAVLCTNAAVAETLRMGLITPPPHQWTLSAGALAERLSEETDKRLQLAIYPSGQLGNEAQMLQQLQSGALDFAFLTIGELANRDADFGILVAPYLVRDAAGARALLQGEVAGALLEKLDTLGLQGLGFGMAGMRQVVMGRGPAVVADTGLSGRKIRTVPLAQELDFWTRAGAAPTPLPLPALYDAFANGQIDGMQIDFEGTFNSRYYEQASVILVSNHMIFPMVAVASARKWQAMSEEDRDLVARLMREETDRILEAYEGIDADYRQRLEGAGVPLQEVGPEFFGGAVESWYEEWRNRTPLLHELEAEAAGL